MLLKYRLDNDVPDTGASATPPSFLDSIQGSTSPIFALTIRQSGTSTLDIGVIDQSRYTGDSLTMPVEYSPKTALTTVENAGTHPSGGYVVQDVSWSSGTEELGLSTDPSLAQDPSALTIGS